MANIGVFEKDGVGNILHVGAVGSMLRCHV